MFIKGFRPSKISNKTLSQQIFENESLTEIFQKFSEKEWSSENVYCRKSIMDYLKKDKKKERKQIAIQIKQKFLIPDTSPLEINAPSNILISAIKKIEDPLYEFDDHLFDDVLKCVSENISDTIARFNFSNELYYFQQAEIDRDKTLGL